MVLREKRISNKSDVVQLHLSHGLPDIKAMLKEYANGLTTPRSVRLRVFGKTTSHLFCAIFLHIIKIVVVLQT